MGNKINKTYIIPATMILGAGLLLTACNNEDGGDKLANVTNKSVQVDAKTNKNVEKDKKDLKNTIKALNSFSGKTFDEILGYNFAKNDFKSQIYSPYSYLSALELLYGNSYYSKDNELTRYKDINLSKYKYDNVKSENLALVNIKKGADSNKIKKLNNFKSVKFPKQAEEESKKLQKRVLDEVILEPKYDDPDLSLILLNATRFEGVWAKKFDKNLTEEESYTLLDGKTTKTKMMHSENLAKADSSLGYEDKEVQIYKKPVSTAENMNKTKEDDLIKRTGDVYIINPKGLGADLGKNKKIIENISKNIEKYVNEFGEKAEKYDDIYVDMPKLDIKNDINLGEIAKKNNKKFILDDYDLKESTGMKDMQKISSILQAASLKLDEEKVDAKAVTQINMMTTSLELNKKEMYIKADHPHFIVITARNENKDKDKDSTVKKEKDSIIFMAFVNNPTQK